ncbi:methyltransferase domain-containing protein [Robiginitalea sp.]|uniref:methyltransferase domain-containing protein n=1 Tax=Robiginitalea sp. TaxID=1902411 RepID=UPI003C34326D
MKLNKAYWQERYEARKTGWDMGMVSPPLSAYIDQLKDKDLNILLPGAGMGYEAVYLAESGFDSLTVLDIAPYPLESLKKRLPPSFRPEYLVEADFFDFEGGPFDLVLEHTFFCALPPQLRPQYALKMNALLRPGGKLAGLLFDFPLTSDGPPFGGSKEEYEQLFAPYFHIQVLERATNSITPRQGSELFFIFEKK